jgi:hypothetical protein
VCAHKRASAASINCPLSVRAFPACCWRAVAFSAGGDGDRRSLEYLAQRTGRWQRAAMGLCLPDVPRGTSCAPMSLAEPSLSPPLKSPNGVPEDPAPWHLTPSGARFGRNDMKGETSHASSFGWCCPGSFRHYTNPCGLLHRSGTDYEAMQDR